MIIDETAGAARAPHPERAIQQVVMKLEAGPPARRSEPPDDFCTLTGKSGWAGPSANLYRSTRVPVMSTWSSTSAQ
jgi:hypothetical protein